MPLNWTIDQLTSSPIPPSRLTFFPSLLSSPNPTWPGSLGSRLTPPFPPIPKVLLVKSAPSTTWTDKASVVAPFLVMHFDSKNTPDLSDRTAIWKSPVAISGDIWRMWALSPLISDRGWEGDWRQSHRRLHDPFLWIIKWTLTRNREPFAIKTGHRMGANLKMWRIQSTFYQRHSKYFRTSSRMQLMGKENGKLSRESLYIADWMYSSCALISLY